MRIWFILLLGLVLLYIHPGVELSAPITCLGFEFKNYGVIMSSSTQLVIYVI